MIGIKNEFLSAVISEHGAELQSLRCGGREYVWQGAPGFWSEHAPVLFPICGAVKGDRYELNGSRYSIPKHGFAKRSEFEIEYSDASAVVLLLRDSAETRQAYPFSFELRVSFQLLGRRLKVCYDAVNTGSGVMYLSMGGHEAYALPGGLERYQLIFPNAEKFESRQMREGLLSEDRVSLAPEGKVLRLNASLFTRGTMIFDRMLSKTCVLCRDDHERAVRVCWDDFRNFLVWTQPGADFVCLEPWSSLPDTVTSEQKLEEIPYMSSLWPNETLSKVHTLEILET